MPNAMNIVLMLLFLLCWILVLRKMMRNRFATVKTVQAKVVDRYQPDIVSNYPGTFKPERYIVVFETKEQRLSFDVSKFSYDNYRIQDQGTLKYKGTKIISFQ